MKMRTLSVVAVVLSALSVDAAQLRARATQEPDTACGKGFENLVQGSQDYYRTAAVELFKHPLHTMDNATFEQEFECWFASMCTTKCGGLPPLAEQRKKSLTDMCSNVADDWLKIWNLFTQEEVKWFKANYPSAPVEDAESDNKIFYKQAMETAKEVNKKEVLCLTLFTIDDECVKWPYIRLSK
mmetsp:Transcript_22575/g.33833  ORF Transcript_22575/g.33833 Transcript_22575/m.33833 type:complete len:184 (-) Transcript_22575:72-623(-)